jgi:hypothetical protein
MIRFGLPLAVQAMLLGCGAAAAATLDQDACARLKTELLQLELAGTRNDMAQGPDWAKANLSGGKLAQIKRLIEIEEQLSFRCQGKPLVALPEGGVDGEAASAERGKEPAGPAKAATDMKATKGSQPAGKAQAKQPAASKGAVSKAPAADKTAPGAQPSAAPPKPKPKAKPKVDDAYRPPPVSSPAGAGANKP